MYVITMQREREERHLFITVYIAVWREEGEIKGEEEVEEVEEVEEGEEREVTPFWSMHTQRQI